jgi:hypothetical protein
VPTIPSLPTDHLYKFAALLGLTIMVVVPPYCWSLRRDLQRQEIDVEGDRQTFELEKQEFDRTVEELADKPFREVHAVWMADWQRRYDAVVADGDSDSIEVLTTVSPRMKAMMAELQEDNKQFTAHNDGIKAKLEAAFARKLELKRSESDLSRREKLVDALNNDMRVVTRCSIGAFSFGTLLAGIGFLLWYRRIQVHLDRSIGPSKATAGDGTNTPLDMS